MNARLGDAQPQVVPLLHQTTHRLELALVLEAVNSSVRPSLYQRSERRVAARQQLGEQHRSDIAAGVAVDREQAASASNPSTLRSDRLDLGHVHTELIIDGFAANRTPASAAQVRARRVATRPVADGKTSSGRTPGMRAREPSPDDDAEELVGRVRHAEVRLDGGVENEDRRHCDHPDSPPPACVEPATAPPVSTAAAAATGHDGCALPTVLDHDLERRSAYALDRVVSARTTSSAPKKHNTWRKRRNTTRR